MYLACDTLKCGSEVTQHAVEVRKVSGGVALYCPLLLHSSVITCIVMNGSYVS